MKKNNKIKKSVSVLAFLFVCAFVGNPFIVQRWAGHSAVVSFQGGTMPAKGHCAWTDCWNPLRVEGGGSLTAPSIPSAIFSMTEKVRWEWRTEQCSKRPLSVGETKFRLYYTSAKYGDTDATVVVEDNFGKSYEMEFSFNDTDEEEEFARSANKLGSVWGWWYC